MQTIELGGRPIAVMGGSHEEVEEFAEGDRLRADLLTFVDSDGHPLWDGQGAFSPSIRSPNPEEAEAFRQSFAQAVSGGEADADDPGDWLMFLVEVRDTTDGAVEVVAP